jgi:hypothetical protein
MAGGFPRWENLTPESKNALFEILFQCCDAKHDTDDKRATYGESERLMAYTVCKRLPLNFNLNLTDGGVVNILCTLEELIDNYVKDFPGKSIEKKLRAFATANCPELFYPDGPRLLSVGDTATLTQNVVGDRLQYKLNGQPMDELPAGEFIVEDEDTANAILEEYMGTKEGENPFYIGDGCPNVKRELLAAVMASRADSSTGYTGLSSAGPGDAPIFNVRRNVLMSGGARSREVSYSFEGTPDDFSIIVHCTGQADAKFPFPMTRNSGPTLPYLGALCVDNQLLQRAVDARISDAAFIGYYNAWATARGTKSVTKRGESVEEPYASQYNTNMYNFRPILQYLATVCRLSPDELNSVLIAEKGDGDARPPPEGLILYKDRWCGIATIDELCALGAALAKVTYRPDGILIVYTYQSGGGSVWRFIHIPKTEVDEGRKNRKKYERYVKSVAEYNALVERLNAYKQLCSTDWVNIKQQWMTAAGLSEEAGGAAAEGGAAEEGGAEGGAGGGAGGAEGGADPSNMKMLKKLIFEKYIDSKIHFFEEACAQLSDKGDLNLVGADPFVETQEAIGSYVERTAQFDDIAKNLNGNMFSEKDLAKLGFNIRLYAKAWDEDSSLSDTTVLDEYPPAGASASARTSSRVAKSQMVNEFNNVFNHIEMFCKILLNDDETQLYTSALIASLRKLISCASLGGGIVMQIKAQLEVEGDNEGSNSNLGGGARSRRKIYRMVGGAKSKEQLIEEKNKIYGLIENIETVLDEHGLSEEVKDELTNLRNCCMAQLEFLDIKYDYDREFDGPLNFRGVHAILEAAAARLNVRYAVAVAGAGGAAAGAMNGAEGGEGGGLRAAADVSFSRAAGRARLSNFFLDPRAGSSFAGISSEAGSSTALPSGKSARLANFFSTHGTGSPIAGSSSALPRAALPSGKSARLANFFSTRGMGSPIAGAGGGGAGLVETPSVSRLHSRSVKENVNENINSTTHYLLEVPVPGRKSSEGHKSHRSEENAERKRKSFKKFTPATAGPVPVPVAVPGPVAGAMDDLDGGARKNKTRRQTRKHKSKTRTNRPRFTKRTRRNKH